MLSITKINAARNQKSSAKGSYAHYLGGTTTKERGDFDDYARGEREQAGPPPFWACKGAALLGLDAMAEAEQVERLAQGFHPVTGEPLVRGAGCDHVMGLDMTFSAPKDFSAVFAGADQSTRDALIECLQESAKAALGYAESAAVTRHGAGGRIKQVAEAAIAACYTHFASRALDPQLHVHAFMFNVGKRKGAGEWSAMEQRTQFDRKMATGILFRVELASRLKAMGFGIVPAGPFFAIRGIEDAQRDALSKRSQQINDRLREQGLIGVDDSAAAKEVAALNSRAAKAEPPLPELIKHFEAMAAELGINPASVKAMMNGVALTPETEFSVDHQAILDGLMASQSCATAQEALARICELAMGRWDATRCLQELDRFMQHVQVVRLGRTELLTEVFTSKATQTLEREISDRVEAGKLDTRHALATKSVEREFDRLEASLHKQLGVTVSLDQQRKAALHVASGTGQHAFVEGWAGTGKTTMLKALGNAYKDGGFTALGCCQSAAAALNLSRETGIASRTIASLLLAIQDGRTKLTAKTVLVLDEAGMVGSREFDLLQQAVVAAGSKLVCVGDPKQLQPIEAGGIFASLMRAHGKAEISNIQRQRTDFEPLLDWLQREQRGKNAINKQRAKALRAMPEDARAQALEDLCSADPKLARAFEKWRARFDYEWMREAVELFATGHAQEALDKLEAHGRLKLMSSPAQALDALISAWDQDKTPIERKAMIAGTRAEVASVNDLARSRLVARGMVDDARSVEIVIKHRDDTTSDRRFAPGDRIVFTMNDMALGVANGMTGRIAGFDGFETAMAMAVELDDANGRGERHVRIPAAFGRFDLAYCLTNHKSQGRTFDSAYALVNPAMADREWSYVAASRSRFATTLFVNAAALGLIDPESHRTDDHGAKNRAKAIEALASRMKRSRAKGTTLDFEDIGPLQTERPQAPNPSEPSLLGLLKGLARRAALPLAKAREAR